MVGDGVAVPVRGGAAVCDGDLDGPQAQAASDRITARRLRFVGGHGAWAQGNGATVARRSNAPRGRPVPPALATARPARVVLTTAPAVAHQKDARHLQRLREDSGDAMLDAPVPSWA